MKIQFAGLCAEVPDAWRDESTITYTMPPNTQLVPSLHPNARPQSQANVVINWQETQETAPVFLDKRLLELQRGLPGFHLLERGDGGTATDPLPFVVYSFTVQVPLVQLLCCRAVGTRVVCVTGTATPSALEKCRPLFLATAASVATSPSGDD